MYWKVVRLFENPNPHNQYCSVFLGCNLTYLVGVQYTINPEYQGPYTAFKTYEAAKTFALQLTEFAIFECEGDPSASRELRWDTPSGYNWINQGIRTWPYGTVFLQNFILGKKVAEMVNGHFTELV